MLFLTLSMARSVTCCLHWCVTIIQQGSNSCVAGSGGSLKLSSRARDCETFISQVWINNIVHLLAGPLHTPVLIASDRARHRQSEKEREKDSDKTKWDRAWERHSSLPLLPIASAPYCVCSPLSMLISVYAGVCLCCHCLTLGPVQTEFTALTDILSENAQVTTFGWALLQQGIRHRCAETVKSRGSEEQRQWRAEIVRSKGSEEQRQWRAEIVRSKGNEEQRQRGSETVRSEASWKKRQRGAGRALLRVGHCSACAPQSTVTSCCAGFACSVTATSDEGIPVSLFIWNCNSVCLWQCNLVISNWVLKLICGSPHKVQRRLKRCIRWYQSCRPSTINKLHLPGIPYTSFSQSPGAACKMQLLSPLQLFIQRWLHLI